MAVYRPGWLLANVLGYLQNCLRACRDSSLHFATFYSRPVYPRGSLRPAARPAGWSVHIAQAVSYQNGTRLLALVAHIQLKTLLM